MSLWTHIRPPKWFPTAILGKGGWINPKTKEVLVAIRGLTDKRIEELNRMLNIILCEDGSLATLEQDLGNDGGIDFITLEDNNQ